MINSKGVARMKLVVEDAISSAAQNGNHMRVFADVRTQKPGNAVETTSM